MRSLEVDPLLLMLPVGLACSLPFMLLGRVSRVGLVLTAGGNRFWWGLWSSDWTFFFVVFWGCKGWVLFGRAGSGWWKVKHPPVYIVKNRNASI